MGYVAPTWQNGRPPALNAKNMQDISDNLAYVSNNMVNPNLLDNWYFGNPVNQRGASGTISTEGYFFDRWKLVSGSVAINSGGIVLNGTIAQVLEHAVGQTVTATVLTPDGVTDVTPVYDDETKTFTVTTQGKTIRAVKLELGTQQTLAHRENGVWVLNEIPKFRDQLAECQRYARSGYSYTVVGQLTYVGTSYNIPLILPQDMRAVPAITIKEISVFGWGNVPITGATVEWSTKYGAFVRITDLSNKDNFIGKACYVYYFASADL